MRFIEQQLIAVLVETPHETECSVSVSVLNDLGIMGQLEQMAWLKRHRPAIGDKAWSRSGERWLYTSGPVAPDNELQSIPVPAVASWRNVHSSTDRFTQKIVVKPVTPLRH